MGERVVLPYRVYFVGPDGHFVRREDLEAPSDAEAIKAASALSRGAPIELWQGHRLVTLPAPGETGRGILGLFERFTKQK